MKRTVASLLAAALLLFLAGCKGESSSHQDTLALLSQSAAAMAEVSGYRMGGTIEMVSGGAGGQGQSVNMDIRADVQNAGGEMRQHMVVSVAGYEVEAYIIGDTYYQLTPGQGWMKMSIGIYQAQNMNLGLVDAEQMELMARMAEDAKVIEENEETVGLSFHLGEEYKEAAFDLYRRYVAEGGAQLSEEWLRMAEEALAGFMADMRVWISKVDNYFQRMEMEYAISGMAEFVGEVTSSMQLDFFDYGQDIEVVLPAEAEQAREFTFPQ